MLCVHQDVSHHGETCFFHHQGMLLPKSLHQQDLELQATHDDPLVQSTVTARMNYANAMFHILPWNLPNRLKLVQNTCVRLVSRTLNRGTHNSDFNRGALAPIGIETGALGPTIHVQGSTWMRSAHPQTFITLLKYTAPTRTIRSSSQCLLSTQYTTVHTQNYLPSKVMQGVCFNTKDQKS